MIMSNMNKSSITTFEDIKRVVNRCKDRQHNGQKLEDDQ